MGSGGWGVGFGDFIWKENQIKIFLAMKLLHEFFNITSKEHSV